MADVLIQNGHPAMLMTSSSINKYSVQTQTNHKHKHSTNNKHNPK